MNKWLYTRLGVLAVSVAVSVWAGPVTAHAKPPIDVKMLIMGFLLGLLGLQILLVLQFINKKSGEFWRRPSWYEKPFQFKQPIQFFHLGAWLLITSSIVTASITWQRNPEFTLDAIMPLVVGIGMLSGVYLSQVIFKSKYQ
ncbi:MAG: hypothetical protein PHO83_07820 [Geobacteraceae bacterium]|nr:hypothetical protein [Geobacteraceae bacterium]